MIPPLLSAPALALPFWLVVLALGHRVLSSVAIPRAAFSAPEWGIVSLAVGTGLLQYVPYTLAAFGVLSPRSCGIAMLVLVVLLSRDLAYVTRRLLAAIRSFSPRELSQPQALWLIGFGLMMVLLLARNVAPGVFGDDDGYHLASPKRWLQLGRLAYLPSYTNTNAAMGFEMLYALGLSTGNVAATKFIHFSAGLFTLYTLWLAARRMGFANAGLVTISALLITTPIWDLALDFCFAYVDFGAAWMALVSMLLWLIWSKEDDPKLLACMALCGGFAASFKTTSLSIPLVWMAVLVWQRRQRGTSWARNVSATLLFGSVAILPVLPWMARSLVVTGNPVFPLLSSAIPTRDWSPEIARIFALHTHYFSWAVSQGSRLSLHSREAIVFGTAAALAVGCACAFKKLASNTLRGLVLFGGSFSVIGALMAGMVFRYWLPGVMCLVLVIACSLEKRWPVSRLLAWLPCVLVALAFVRTTAKPPGAQPWQRSFAIASGVKNLDQAQAADPCWPMWRFINEQTPSTTHVLFAGFYTSFGASSFGGFWVDRQCFTTDSHLQAHVHLDDWSTFISGLRADGIDLLVLPRTQLLSGRHGFSFSAQRNEYPFSQRLAAEYGEKAGEFGSFDVYRLRLPPNAGESRTSRGAASASF